MNQELINRIKGKKVEMVPNGHIGEEEPKLPAEPTKEAVKTTKFEGNIVFLGFGSVAECTLPILMKHLKVDPDQITIIDMLDKKKVLENWIKKGVNFVQRKIVEDNLEKTLEEFLIEDDILIDLAYDISCVELLQWCRDNKVIYLNTSIEEWDYTDGFDERTPYDKSLYARQQEIDELIESWDDNEGATACIDHGANPGLISHFMKQGLLDLAKKRKVPFKGDYAELAKKIGVKVVLDTERDTQITNNPRQPGEFVNTWSVLGLMEEATSPAELGWGTHEDKLPPRAHEPKDGPKNQIFLSQMGMDTKVRGFVPKDPKVEHEVSDEEVEEINEKEGNRTETISCSEDGYQIQGVLIRHGEAYTISKFLTTKNADYRPTVYYCYQPSDSTVASLQEVRGNDYRALPRQRVIYENDIISGSDALGIMIGGYNDKNVWWTGTILNIEDARKLCPLQNCTSPQVAIGLVAAIMWAIENPNKGVCRPEDLDTNFILKIAKPYLGTFVSEEFNWSPDKNCTNWYPENKDKDIDEKNLWGFQNFIVRG